MSDRTGRDNTVRSLTDRLTALLPEQRALLARRVRHARATGFDLIAESLHRLGVTHIQGVSGRPIDEVFPACARAGIRPIGVHHQTSAVLMAAAQPFHEVVA